MLLAAGADWVRPAEREVAGGLGTTVDPDGAAGASRSLASGGNFFITPDGFILLAQCEEAKHRTRHRTRHRTTPTLLLLT